MITIQSGMLIALGFLAASLIGLLVAPAFWRRAVRLTTRRIKSAMPLSEIEIEADRDRIRAEYAIKMHKLETLVEQVKLAGARQQIEINRRDARVNMLEADLEKLRASYEEAQNARRVLEQTIADRVPRIETRLTEAKKVLHAREREIAELTSTSERQVRALADASAINAQQKGEIERLSALLAQRPTPGEGAASAADPDAALKAELEELRARVREQAQRLTAMETPADPSVATVPEAADAPARLATQLEQAEQKIRDLRARNDDQLSELTRLKAALAVFERKHAAGGQGERESRIALKARLQAVEARSSQQIETIAKLRNEIAEANERLAQQAAHFASELKRLGPAPSVAQPRQAGGARRASLADRVALASSANGGDDLDADSRAGSGSAPTMSPTESASPDAVEAERGESQSERERVLETADASASDAKPGRPRLLDRIAGLSRMS